MRALLTALCTLTVWCAPPTLLAQEQTCRTRCEAREIIDAYGCCALLELPSTAPSSTDMLPDVLAIEDEHARPLFALRAYHMLGPPVSEDERDALITQIIERTTSLKSPGASLTPMQSWLARDALSTSAWRVWMTFESELRVLHDACASASSLDDRAPYQACLGDLESKLAERSTWLELARPI